jgi:hypothetical protein
MLDLNGEASAHLAGTGILVVVIRIFFPNASLSLHHYPWLLISHHTPQGWGIVACLFETVRVLPSLLGLTGHKTRLL